MKLGIMQPYFFPYAQQFRHIAQCDQWIIFDTVKFSRKTWTTRNRVGNIQTEVSYISVPVESGATKDSIARARIVKSEWQSELFNKLRCYEPVAPYYSETINIIKRCIFANHETLGSLNAGIITEICSVLDIETKILKLSDMELYLPTYAAPGEWALIISKNVGASVYSNAPGGRDLFDAELYCRNGIDLEFYESAPLIYATKKLEFVPDLSILDSLMWLGVEGVSRFVKS